VGREELEAKGTPQLADMIMRLPSVVGSENVTAQEQSVGGAGAANINIRNLGLASTLVLLDGKRLNVGTSVSNAGEQFVDINRIPFIMVENIEILKDGASAVYGSDAVAGVANFKTRSNFEGFEIQAMYQDSFKGSAYDFEELGLPEVYRDGVEAFNSDEASDMDIGAIWGFGNDTTNIVIGANYFERDALLTLARDFATERVIDGTVGGPSPFNLPQDQFATTPGLEAFGPTNIINDSSCVALGSYRIRNGGLCSTKNDLLSRDIFSQERRKQLLGTFSHALSDQVEIYGMFGGSENDVVINQSPSFPITSGSSYDANNPGLIYEVESAYAALADGQIPNGDDVANRFVPAPLPVISFLPGPQPGTPAEALGRVGTVNFNGVARPSVVHLQHALGVPADVNGDGVVSEGETFRGRNQSKLDRETRLFSIGARGDINESWSFDTSYTYSSEKRSTTFYDTVVSRLENALNGYFGTGCDVNDPNQAPGEGLCTWFNPFGNSVLQPDLVVQDGFGNDHTLGNDAAYTDALFGEGVETFETRLSVIDAVFSTGSLGGWTLGGGGVGFAIGAQFRQEDQRVGGNELATDPSFPFAFTGPSIPYSADQTIYAVFGELALPVTDALEVQLALRYEDYGGETGDTLDPKLAARWEVTNWMALRGSVSTSFRGPSLNQQFGRATGLQFTAAPSEEQIIAAGLDPATTGNFGSGVFARLPTFGNEALGPEDSTNFNIGIILNPTDTLSLSIDYWNYDFQNIIVGDDFAGLANDCQIAWGLAGRPASTLGVEACNFRNLDGDVNTPDIVLDAAGNALSIESSYTNGTQLKASGLDFLGRYDLGTDFGNFGTTLDLSWFLTYEIDRLVTPFDTRLNPGETVDLVGVSENVLVSRPLPEWKMTWLFDWSLRGHYANLVVNHVSSVVEPFSQPPNLKVDGFTTVDASYTYNFDNIGLGLTAGAVNLTDEDPPTASGFNGFESTIHDPRGRMWYFRLRYTL
jgi:iron complex outermembrane receptor protein